MSFTQDKEMANVTEAFERFDKAAQAWGWEADQGTTGVAAASAEYEAAGVHLQVQIAKAIEAAKAEGDHFLSYFTALAKEHPAANAALDTARREWAKKGEG